MARCEASIGVDFEGHMPRVLMCPNEGKLRKNRREWRFPNELCFCDDHAYMANPKEERDERRRDA